MESAIFSEVLPIRTVPVIYNNTLNQIHVMDKAVYIFLEKLLSERLKRRANYVLRHKHKKDSAGLNLDLRQPLMPYRMKSKTFIMFKLNKGGNGQLWGWFHITISDTWRYRSKLPSLLRLRPLRVNKSPRHRRSMKHGFVFSVLVK